jgi:hypothetical protein
MIRQKAHTVSGPTLPEDFLTRVNAKPETLKLERWRTFQVGQDIPRPERTSAITRLVESSQLTRLESKPEQVSDEETTPSDKQDDKPVAPKIDHSRRKSLLFSTPPVRPSWPPIQILSTARGGLRSQRMPEGASAKGVLQTQGHLSAKPTNYVDAGVQTEIEEPSISLRIHSSPMENTDIIHLSAGSTCNINRIDARFLSEPISTRRCAAHLCVKR